MDEYDLLISRLTQEIAPIPPEFKKEIQISTLPDSFILFFLLGIFSFLFFYRSKREQV